MRNATQFVLAQLTAVMLLAGGAWASHQAPKPDLPPNAADLVRKTIDNELKPGNNKVHFTYRLTRRLPDRVETREMVETDHVVVGRLLLINGQPLTPEQRQREDKRLQRLVNDPAALAGKQKEQRDDDERTRNMVRALPDAFTYQYAGTQQHAPWGEVVVLNFSPNPRFSPPTRETLVYRGMQGIMWIAIPQQRLAKIEARLFRDVNFGWGILGHLDSGGEFQVEQQPVADNMWEPTHMVLNFTGKALLFKTIRIRQDQTTSDYRPVPDMTIAQAVELLKKRDSEIAENKGK